LHRYRPILTCFEHACLGDAQLLGGRVQTLNDDIAACISVATVNLHHQTSAHSGLQISTNSVRVRVDCSALARQRRQTSDAKVVQTVYCSKPHHTIQCHRLIHSLFHSRLKTFLFCKCFSSQPFLFFFRTDYMDSPDSLLLLLSISVFTF